MLCLNAQMLGNYDGFYCTITLYSNDINSPIMNFLTFYIQGHLKSIELVQSKTLFCVTIKVTLIYGIPWTNILRSSIKPIGFVIIWFAIYKL